MTDDLKFNIEVGTSGERDVRNLASALEAVGEARRKVGDNKGANQADRMAKSLVGEAKAAREAAKSLTEYQRASAALVAARPDQFRLGKSGQALTTAGKQVSHANVQAELEAIRVEQQRANVLRVLGAQAQYAAKGVQELTKRTNESNAAQGKASATGNVQNLMGQYFRSGYAQQVSAVTAANQKLAKQEQSRATAINRLTAANIAAAEAEMKHANRLTNMRYALYDVQRSFVVTGLALLGFNALTVKAAADYETAMASISRTSGISGEGLIRLRNDFQDLASSIPTAFKDIADIGTLAGQLNVPANNIAEFTKVTAQFSATTNVTAEAAATAFGRLDALLPEVQGNYEALGSSILNVGVNSVATESEIISTTSQIAAAGSQAGLTAKQIIGLAASYASLGVAPEASRGTTIRFFAKINEAVNEGGANLTRFAELSGKSAKSFRDDWQYDAGAAFLDLLNGMQKVTASGQNLESVIKSMGITAVRDINAILKLAQNAEIVADNFNYAAEGFDNATQLSDAFGIQAATLASKLQMLVNTAQAFFAELGQSAIGPLGAIVDGLKEFIKFLTMLAKNPVVQWGVLITGVFTGLVGVVSLAGFAFSRLLAAVIAFRTSLTTAKYEIVQTTGGLGSMRVQAAATASAFAGTTVSVHALRSALQGLLLGFAGTAAISVAIWGITEAVNALRPATDKAKAAWGDLSGLTSALKEDTREVKEGLQEGMGEVEGSISRTTSVTAGWVSELENATGATVNLGDGVQIATSRIDDMTYAIGANTAAWLANKLGTEDAVKRAYLGMDALANRPGASSGDVSGIISAAVKNDTETAQRLLAEFGQKIEEFRASNLYNLAGGDTTFSIMTQQYNDLQRIVDLTSGSLQEAAIQGEINTTVNEALGVSASSAASGQDELTDSIDSTSSALDTMRQLVDGAFSSMDLLGTMSNDFYQLASGIYESGTAFDVFSQVGRGNLENFKASISSIIVAGESMGLSAEQSVAALFLQLQKMGIDTANLLASLANIPGISVGGVTAAMDDASVSGGYLSQVLDQVGGAAKQAGQSLGGGGRRSTSGGARNAAKEMRTLVDYANDLRSVMSRAFDIRFSGDSAMDKLNKGWIDIANATAEALRNISEIEAKLAKLQSEQQINTYFLGVAEKYGDTKRAVDLRADLAKNEADIASANNDLVKAQNKANKSLTGNSEAAIENREVISGLVKDNIALIEAWASSGMSQAELANKTRQLKQEFITQAVQAGYSRQEIEKYAAAFDDMGTIIRQIPRNVTVNFSGNAALTAIKEFKSKAQKELGAGGGISMPVRTSFSDAGWKKAARGAALMATIQSYLGMITRQPTHPSVPNWKASLEFYKNKLNSGNYWSGGYTGPGGKYEPKGVVHGREFVVNAENTAKFRPLLEQMNRGRLPIAAPPGPKGIQVVELSARDRALLAAAGNVSLSIDGKVVGQVTNSANFVSTKRGSA